ncbi:transmembrane 220 family protein [Marinoscillum sp.]|uniref:transmembrane 220 family protein n=1 Tax=Marinoscillum sp. TaxID=2024838 RepID=UPI003BACDF81
MNSKRIHFIIAGLFIVFAAVQYNDPDPWLWILIYGAVALVAIVKVYFSQVNFTPLILTLLLILLFYTFTFIPSVLDFFESSNKSDLVGKMKAEDPWIEGTREFGGLLIAIIALNYLKRSKIN